MPYSLINTPAGFMEETSSNESKVDFRWTMRLGATPRRTSECYSPGIKAFDSTWYFYLYPNGKKTSSWGWIGLDICRRESLEKKIWFTVSVKLDDGKERTIVNNRMFPTESSCFEINEVLPWLQLLCPSRTDKMTIICSLWKDTLSPGEEKASQETQAEGVSDAVVKEECVDPTLLKHLKDLLLSGEDHDITINVRNREFKAHRGMLRARSPVFEAMFKHYTKESASNSISIDDCDPDAFGEFLNYVYTGRVEDLTSGVATGLYYAADKYDFPSLKEVCVQFLEASLSKTSICDVISLATMHGESGLLEKAIGFFSKNSKEILMTVEWQRFAEKNFAVSNELCIKAFEALEKKK